MTETLYVFISGFRRAYITGVLNAVCRPIGSTQTFQYSIDKSVTTQTLNKLAALEVGADVLLVFVDRFSAGGYTYRAARRARFVSAIADSGRAELTIELREWPLPVAGQDISAWITANLPDAPRLTNNDPNTEYDGQYALVANSVPSGMLAEGDGWRPLCEWLASTTALRTTESQTTVFARIDVLDTKEDKTAEWFGARRPRQKMLRFLRRDAMLKLGRSRTYRARVTYYFPLQRTNQRAEIPYSVRLSTGLEPLSAMIGNASAESRSETFDLKLVALTQRSRESIVLEFGPASGEFKGLTAPRLELPVRPRLSVKLWASLIAIGLFWVIGSGYMAEEPTTWRDYAGPALQFFAVILMFRVFGTKLT